MHAPCKVSVSRAAEAAPPPSISGCQGNLSESGDLEEGGSCLGRGTPASSSEDRQRRRLMEPQGAGRPLVCAPSCYLATTRADARYIIDSERRDRQRQREIHDTTIRNPRIYAIIFLTDSHFREREREREEREREERE